MVILVEACGILRRLTLCYRSSTVAMEEIRNLIILQDFLEHNPAKHVFYFMSQVWIFFSVETKGEGCSNANRLMKK